MNSQLLTLARQNYAALLSLSQFLHKRGTWPTGKTPGKDVAMTTYDLFHSLAWSDRKLNSNEYKLLDAILEEDHAHFGHLDACIAEMVGLEAKPATVPPIIEAAVAHDNKYGTHFADIALNHLENLGLMIILSDTKVDDIERFTYKIHFDRIRSQMNLKTQSA